MDGVSFISIHNGVSVCMLCVSVGIGFIDGKCNQQIKIHASGLYEYEPENEQ